MKTPSDFSIAEVVAGREAQGEKEPWCYSVRNSTAEITPTFNLDSVKPNGRMPEATGQSSVFDEQSRRTDVKISG